MRTENCVEKQRNNKTKVEHKLKETNKKQKKKTKQNKQKKKSGEDPEITERKTGNRKSRIKRQKCRTKISEDKKLAKRRLRWSRVFIAMCGLSLSIFAVDGLRRDVFETKNEITIEGDFVEKNSVNNSETIQKERTVILGNGGSQPTTIFEGVQNLGYSELSVPPSKLNSGALVIINDEYPADGSVASVMVSLLKNKSEDYSLINESIRLNEEAAEALNSMMAAYHEATGLTDFVVYGTNDTFTGEGSLCPEYFPESVTGNTIDLAVTAYGTPVTFDGKDAEGWILDNCHKYGYIVRYPHGKEMATGQKFCPWHLRYVGMPHAALMAEKGLCLEEYVEFLKNYTYGNALIYSYDDVEYEIYTSEAVGETASARVPISGNYSISGDNIGTYIITVEKN